MNVTKVLISGYEDARLHRLGQNKPNQTQLQTQANGFFKILPRLLILVNLPLNPADRKNRNGLQAQNAQPFLLKNAETKDPDKPNS